MVEKENVCAEENGAEQAVIAAQGTKEDGCPQTGSTAPKKFKDADALARAYGALEAEFTRRSQRIKELEKEVENLKSGLGDPNGSGAKKLRRNAETRRTAAREFDKFVQELGKAEAVRESEEKESLSQAETGADTSGVQALESFEKGAEQAECVLQKTEEAGKAACGDEGEAVKAALQESGNALSVVGEKQELSSDELYARVNRDEGVRLKIIGEYLTSLGKNAPPLTAGGVGSMLAPPLRAKSIADAGNLALQYLKKPFDK